MSVQYVCICVCAHVNTGMYQRLLVSDSVIWIGWDVDKNTAQKQSIIIAGCNFQLVGAQWCRSGVQQTETFVTFLLAHLYVNLTFPTPFNTTAWQVDSVFGWQSFCHSIPRNISLFMKMMKAKYQNMVTTALKCYRICLSVILYLNCRYFVSLWAVIGTMLVVMSQPEIEMREKILFAGCCATKHNSQWENNINEHKWLFSPKANIFSNCYWCIHPQTLHIAQTLSLTKKISL